MECNLPQFKGTKKGRIYLTTHRVIFNNKSAKETLQSFAMPFYCMHRVELEQPIFGANCIKGQVLAESSGNWEGEGKFKIVFMYGGAIEFGQAMLQAGRLATRHMPPQPPPYTPPSGPFHLAPPPAYAPPTGPQYGFVPYQAFPNVPPANGVFMTEAPPPYPGIDGTTAVYSPLQQNPKEPPDHQNPAKEYPPPLYTTYPPQYPPPQFSGPFDGPSMSEHGAEAAPPAYNRNDAPPPYSDQNSKKDQ